ncbi:MAG: hypothetical protein HKM98_08065, partial [Gammaproteobacteria bacterium]|nr:hypothetical protein [Gammaproteobacteria bacterium]
GDNRVTLNGSIGEQLAINYDVDVSDLGSFSKDYSGMLKGAGRLAGTLSAPQVDMALTGRDLRIAGYAAGSVDINGQLLPEKTASELVLSARQLEISGRPVDSLDATLKGEIGEHQVMLQASMDKRSLSASLSGGWQEQKWRGQLGDVLIDLGPQGQWQQTDKTNLVFDAEQLQLESLCLQQESALACAQGSLGLKNIDASILLDRFPLAPLTAYLPAGVTVKGEAGGQIMLSGSAREPLADLRLSSSTIALHYSYSEDDDVVDTTLRDLLLTARADINNLNFDLQVAGDDIRSLSLNARLDNWRDASPRIVAKLDANIPDVAFLSMLSTEVSGWKGSAAADFTVSGLLSAPQLEGFIRLENGSAELRGAGITLQQLEIVARPSGAGRLGVTASAVSGNGKIELDGMLALDAKAGWPVSGSLSGSDFSALQLPGLDVVVSPDLTISGDAGMLQLRGTVVAPRAKVEIRQLPEQAVSVSSDVVIQGVENQSKKSLLQVDTDIEVLLGDAVSFSGFGLSASLAGQIALRVPPDRPATGRGVVKIKSGKFQAYGQDLSIENGRLIFSGALDDPTLDVEANRKIADVTVGVRIAGTGQSPEATIYSVPSMPEAEALSYLVIGRPLASATDAEGEQLKNSAILLGLKQALPIADQIGRAVGLDELGLDTSSTDTGAIMAGKQVGSDLYVRYSFGLFDRIGALLLRYRVNRNVSLEARSAEDQSLDVIYSRGRE